MRFHYGKKAYLYTFLAIVIILTVVRHAFPLFFDNKGAKTVDPISKTLTDSVTTQALWVDSVLRVGYTLPRDLSVVSNGKEHKMLSVSSFERCFPDVNDVQIITARRLGVQPVENRSEAENDNSHKLVYAGSNPYYFVKKLHNSIPYLVPRAQFLLTHIAHTFIDSLMVKKINPSIIIVTSLTRSKQDVAVLRKHNTNASENSCHCYGTTFDISYTKYHPIQDPDAPPVHQTRDDTLRWVLSEVLRDQRNLGLCYVKYETHQGCYHITVR